MTSFTQGITASYTSDAPEALQNKAGMNALDISVRFQTEMDKINDKIIEAQNSNLAETEKMFTLQLLVNTYTTMGQTRTSMVKAHADMVKACARNIS
ncbi:hypothetical protein PSE_3714 [Pseudovibrio sp. FO-BEG1]|uniref:Uncharacterized protein n=2 Tax=Pseudovibrio TaxID=258255 RepID=A0A1I7BK08_9HYPH|nr:MULTISPECIES: hypothetical protein [Pseudovibrio]AEV38218.1 hypothetical protein PSE_3714 [Pseudovibrio sp. FO-BEG1]QUS54382.1 hypothetical protein KGB56_13355 [Pseudovibrio brasiliensis]SFT87520.1 hypothetical protein SAMN05444141_10431 [Pseudovibrio denitrificans]